MTITRLLGILWRGNIVTACPFLPRVLIASDKCLGCIHMAKRLRLGPTMEKKVRDIVYCAYPVNAALLTPIDYLHHNNIIDPADFKAQIAREPSYNS